MPQSLADAWQLYSDMTADLATAGAREGSPPETWGALEERIEAAVSGLWELAGSGHTWAERRKTRPLRNEIAAVEESLRETYANMEALRRAVEAESSLEQTLQTANAADTDGSLDARDELVLATNEVASSRDRLMQSRSALGVHLDTLSQDVPAMDSDPTS